MGGLLFLSEAITAKIIMPGGLYVATRAVPGPYRIMPNTLFSLLLSPSLLFLFSIPVDSVNMTQINYALVRVEGFS